MTDTAAAAAAATATASGGGGGGFISDWGVPTYLFVLGESESDLGSG